jgi:release factor glutamine methyltransferase
MLGALTGLSGRMALRDAAGKLETAGCPAGVWEAAQLLADAIGEDLRDLNLHLDCQLSESAADRLRDNVERRAGREPLAYVLGYCRFRQLRLSTDPRVLVPWEPATGVLVDFGLELPVGSRVHDVGTGSGAVALALKHERPDLVVTGSDISPGAVDVARENASQLGLDVGFEVVDGLPSGEYDLVIANLPYASEADAASSLPPESSYLPKIAVVAGPDGLELIRALIASAAPGTRVALEHSPAQADAVRRLLTNARSVVDRSGAERATVGDVV